MNCLLVMKIKWSLDINTGAVERSVKVTDTVEGVVLSVDFTIRR